MYATRYNRIILPLFYLFDSIILISIYLMFYFSSNIIFDLFDYKNFYLLLFLINWFLFCYYYKIIDIRRLINIKKYIFNVIIIISINCLLTLIFVLVNRFDVELITILKYFIFYSSLYIISANLIRYYYLNHYRSKGYNVIYSAAIFPEDFNGINIIKSELKILGYDIIKQFHVSKNNTLKSIIDKLNEYTVSAMFLIHPNEFPFKLDNLIDACDNNGIRVKILPNYSNYMNKRIGADIVAGYAIIDLREEPLVYLHNRIMKRLIDIFVAGLSIVFVLSILPIFIKIFQIIFDRGPLLFKQKRIGRNGNIFTIYKFRTLKENKFIEKSNVVGGFDQELHNADFERRITKLGQFLRKTNLDEYPQFFNVLFGNMSVVGPRPILISSDHELSSKIPKYSVRRFIKPGVTGWAQVNGYRGSIQNQDDIEKRTELDLYYLENWSILFDIKIIFLTIWQMLTFSIPNAD